MTEVEIKARVDGPEEIEGRIAALAEYRGEYLKEDRYYCPAGREAAGGGAAAAAEEEAAGAAHSAAAGTAEAAAAGAGGRESLSERASFRLRLQGEEALVTSKRKRMEGDHEVNEEHEFSVSDSRAFEAFVIGLGYRVCARKRKQGRQYRTADGAGVEIAEVSGLGWYVEIEIMVEEGDSEGVEDAKRRIVELFERLGIGREGFERRYYIDMLAEAGKD